MTQLLLLDQSFELAKSIEELCHTCNSTLEVANQAEEVKLKIEKNSYQGILIHETTAKQNLAFISWIRKELGKDLLLALLSPAFDQLDDYQVLKEEYDVNFVLPTFVSLNHLISLVKNLCAPREEWESNKIFKALPAALQKKYRDSLYPKFQHLESLFKTIQADPTSIDALRDIRFEVHKITGSAGAYGYKETSEMCRFCEVQVQEFINQEQKKTIPEDLINYLHQFLINMRLSFQHISSVEKKSFIS